MAQNTCHSYKMCLNSRGAAWASVEVYNALEPLLEQHNLAGGMSSLVTVSAAEPADLPCSCSTPVAVEFSLPEGEQQQPPAREGGGPTGRPGGLQQRGGRPS